MNRNVKLHGGGTGKLKNRRLDAELGQNELREYLENKSETALSGFPVEKPELVRVRKPFGRPIKVLLVSPPISIPKGMLKRCIPPLGLSYIAAILEKYGVAVNMVDCVVEGHSTEREIGAGMITYGLRPEDIRERVRDASPDVVGISVLFSTDIENLFETCRVIRSLDRNIVIVVGGLHPTIYPQKIVERSQITDGSDYLLDFIIRGEGEYRFLSFVQNLQEGLVDKNADGLVSHFEGEWIYRHQRTLIENLDELPLPAYHLLPMERYFEINTPFSPVPQGNRVVQLLTSRGCPVGCTFCASTNLYRKYRHRSVKNIIREVQAWKSRYKVDEIQFVDDNLTFVRGHSIDLFKALAPLSLKWCTPNGTMVNTLTPELMDLMAKSGLYQITLSLDSGSVETLKTLHHKPVKLNSIPGLIDKAKEYGIYTHGTLVVGMPGETLDDIRAGFEFVKTLDLTSISTFIAAAIPGSELYHQVLEKGLINNKDAEAINTTKCKMLLTDIDPLVLEATVLEFQEEFSTLVKERDPELWHAKYGRLLEQNPEFDMHYGGRLT